MPTGMNLENKSDARKTTVIKNKILVLRLILELFKNAGYGSIREKGYKFIQFGKSVNEHWECGLGFAVKNTLLQSVEVKSDGNQRVAAYFKLRGNKRSQMRKC